MSVAKAMMASVMGDEEASQAYVNHALLVYGVQRQIFCQRTGDILDTRRAVMVTITKGAARQGIMLTGEAWDEVAEDVRASAAEIGAVVEVIEGRSYTSKGELRKR